MGGKPKPGNDRRPYPSLAKGIAWMAMERQAPLRKSARRLRDSKRTTRKSRRKPLESLKTDSEISADDAASRRGKRRSSRAAQRARTAARRTVGCLTVTAGRRAESDTQAIEKLESRPKMRGEAHASASKDTWPRPAPPPEKSERPSTPRFGLCFCPLRPDHNWNLCLIIRIMSPAPSRRRSGMNRRASEPTA
jgi:hypothetical protein